MSVSIFLIEKVEKEKEKVWIINLVFVLKTWKYPNPIKFHPKYRNFGDRIEIQLDIE